VQDVNDKETKILLLTHMIVFVVLIADLDSVYLDPEPSWQDTASKVVHAL